MTDILIAVAVTVPASAVYGSFFEWLLHRYVMHRTGIITYPYRTHAVVHHGLFGSGKDYQLQRQEDKKLVTMAWWNAPVLLLINVPAALGAWWLSGTWWAFGAFMGTLLVYYGLYEYLHWCMHVPAQRWFQKMGFFRWLDRHHRLHHLLPDRNLNVVLPVADLILRTRVARAPMV